MMHIGYATMGRGWADLYQAADKICQMLGITVPLDRVSPLAPYGGMWIGRPEALRPLSDHAWSFADYDFEKRGKLGRLAHLQERLIAVAAAQCGFHVRTVLTPEHAAISHTALDFKVDELFSTTRGYPVEQIQLLHRAGFTGYGGVVAIARMYLRVNHPRIVAFLRPGYHLAFRAYGGFSAVRSMMRRRREREEV
jgi:lipopolysaccharide biosynthesis protein